LLFPWFICFIIIIAIILVTAFFLRMSMAMLSYEAALNSLDIVHTRPKVETNLMWYGSITQGA